MHSRLFLHELNIDYEDKLYSYGDTWPSLNEANGVSETGTLPILEIDDQRLYQVRVLPLFRKPWTDRLFKRPVKLSIAASILPFFDTYPAVLAHTTAKQTMRSILLMR